MALNRNSELISIALLSVLLFGFVGARSADSDGDPSLGLPRNYLHQIGDCERSKESTTFSLLDAVSLFMGFLLFGMIFGFTLLLFCVFKEKIKLWIFAHNLFPRFVTNDDLDEDKKYDAFISFTRKNEDFVMENILSKLESGPKPFKCCLHTRDWIAGELIIDNILNSVNSSRRTIVVISKEFLASDWLKKEFEAAHQQAIADGVSRLVVVTICDLGDIQDIEDKLCPILKGYLKGNLYIKYDDVWFYDKLRYALTYTNRLPIQLPIDA